MKYSYLIFCLQIPLLLLACNNGKDSVVETYTNNSVTIPNRDTENIKDTLAEKLSEETIHKISTELGTQAKPHKILIDGANIDTGCMAWSVKYNDLFTSHNEAIDLITKIRTILKDQPVIVYDGGPDWEEADPDASTAFPYLVVICGTRNPFNILRIEETDGVNYGLDTERIINFLHELDQEFGIDIVGANSGGVWFVLKRIPEGEEANQLRKRLLDFAPDIEDDSLTDGFVSLWWD